MPPRPAVPEVDLAALMEENRALKAQLTARREEQRESYVPKPLDLTEYKTRKLYIDAMLTDAGWTEGNCPACPTRAKWAMPTMCSTTTPTALWR